MTATAVLPGLIGNQLLGNQSIFDFEKWLVAHPPLPLRGRHAQEILIQNSHKRLKSFDPINTSHYFTMREARSHSTQLPVAVHFLNDITLVAFRRGKFSLTDKSHFLCFFPSEHVTPEWFQTPRRF